MPGNALNFTNVRAYHKPNHAQLGWVGLESKNSVSKSGLESKNGESKNDENIPAMWPCLTPTITKGCVAFVVLGLLIDTFATYMLARHEDKRAQDWLAKQKCWADAFHPRVRRMAYVIISCILAQTTSFRVNAS
jgi:hypothetical protein